MKVLFTFGGLPHYYNYVLSRLNEVKNLEIVAVAPKKDTESIGIAVKQSIEGINFSVIYLEEFKTPYGNLFLKNLDKTILKEKPDIVVTIWPYILGFVYYFKHYQLLRKNNIKLILKEIPFKVPHFKGAYKYYKSENYLKLTESLEPQEKVNRQFWIKYHLLSLVRILYYKFMLDASVNYTKDAKSILNSYGLGKEKIFITGNSPDTELIKEAFSKIKNKAPILANNPHRIIHVGRLVKWKKVHLIIEALNFLKNKYPKIELLIIGKGPETENLKHHARELDVEKNVKFIGGVYENENLGQYFMVSSLYVLAGMGGLSINQAMAFAKPVICSHADGTEKELVKEAYNGYYFKENNARNLADKIDLLLSHPEKIKEMGQNSLNIIQNEININSLITRYLEAFNYVTNNKFQLKT